MGFDLQSIVSGTQNRPPRIVLLGVEKIGKSTFAAGADRPIFLPIEGEEGIDSLDVARFPAVGGWTEILAAMRTLAAENHDYRTVVIDSASALEPLIWGYVCSEFKCASIEQVGGGYAKGYTESVTHWRKLCQMLDYLRREKGMASIIIGHVQIKVFNDPEGLSYDTYTLDIHSKASNVLYRWADSILFANTKVVSREQDAGFGKKRGTGIELSPGARYLFTQKRPAHPGGGRGIYGHLPYELPLSWGAFCEACGQVQ